MSSARERKGWLAAFGRAVRELRQKRGLSQETLGFACGIDRTYVSGIERGMRNPTLWAIVRLSEGLGTTPSDIVRLAERKRAGR